MLKDHGKVLILGIGNDILKDDGIGPKLAEQLRNENFSPEISFDSCSLGGLDVLEIIKDYDSVFILDALKTIDGEPGQVYYFSPEDFRETLHLSNLHDVNFLTALEMAKRINMKTPRFIEIIAVEIIEDLEFGQSLSPELENKYSTIYKEIHEHLKSVLNIHG
jgi:hydrogenase maturation protease